MNFFLDNENISVSTTRPSLNVVCDFGLEESLIHSENQKRQVEFRAGRRSAQKAMLALGVRSRPLLVGRDRSPLWPKGHCGSISHTAEMSVAIVGARDNYLSLGVDVETFGKLPEDMLRLVFKNNEIECLRYFCDWHFLEVARLLFSCKESVYKCVSFLTGVDLDFHDIEILPSKSTFEVKLKKAFSQQRLFGAFYRWKGFVFTGVSIKA